MANAIAPQNENLKGITWDKWNRKWKARKWNGSRLVSLGYYDTSSAASAAYAACGAPDSQPKNRTVKPKRERNPHKGVSWDSHNNAWRARAVVNGSRVSLGYFKSAEDAIEAVTRALEQARNQ